MYVYVCLCVFSAWCSGPALSLCVLQDLLVQPALPELLALLHEQEEPEVLLWIHLARQDVLRHVHLGQQTAAAVWAPQAGGGGTEREGETETRERERMMCFI